MADQLRMILRSLPPLPIGKMAQCNQPRFRPLFFLFLQIGGLRNRRLSTSKPTLLSDCKPYADRVMAWTLSNGKSIGILLNACTESVCIQAPYARAFSAMTVTKKTA